MRWTEDKAADHFICTGLHRRVIPLCPGIARSPVSGPNGLPRRRNPVQIKWLAALSVRDIYNRTVNRNAAGQPEKNKCTHCQSRSAFYIISWLFVIGYSDLSELPCRAAVHGAIINMKRLVILFAPGYAAHGCPSDTGAKRSNPAV